MISYKKFEKTFIIFTDEDIVLKDAIIYKFNTKSEYILLYHGFVKRTLI